MARERSTNRGEDSSFVRSILGKKRVFARETVLLVSFRAKYFFPADPLNFLFVVFQGPPQPGQQYKFSIGELCDRIKEDFNFLQTQYHR